MNMQEVSTEELADKISDFCAEQPVEGTYFVRGENAFIGVEFEKSSYTFGQFPHSGDEIWFLGNRYDSQGEYLGPTNKVASLVLGDPHMNSL